MRKLSLANWVSTLNQANIGWTSLSIQQNLSTNGWHRVNDQNIHAESMFMVLGDNNHVNVYLEPGPWFKAENNPFDATKNVMT